MCLSYFAHSFTEAGSFAVPGTSLMNHIPSDGILGGHWSSSPVGAILMLTQQVFYLLNRLPSPQFPDANLEISPLTHSHLSLLGLGKCPRHEIHTYFLYLSTEKEIAY